MFKSHLILEQKIYSMSRMVALYMQLDKTVGNVGITFPTNRKVIQTIMKVYQGLALRRT